MTASQIFPIVGGGARPMQRKSLKLRFLFCPTASILVGMLLFWGCGGTATDQQVPTQPYQGLSLNVACPNGPVADVITRYAQSWLRREDARLQLVPYPADTGPETVEPADIWVVPAAGLGRIADASRLAPVPELYLKGGQYAWEDLLPLYRERLLVWYPQPYAFPMLGEGPLCFYRSDLMDAAEHRAGFRRQYGRDLQPPTTWEEFADIADYFNQHRQEGSPSPSLPPLPATDEDLTREFYTIAAPLVRRAAREAEKTTNEAEVYSFHYDLQTGLPRIATPGFVHALQLLQRLQKYRAPTKGQTPLEAFAAGQAVLCLGETSWISRFHNQPAIRGRFRFCRMPGSQKVFDYRTGQPYSLAHSNYVPYLGSASWLAVVPRGRVHTEAAFSLLGELSGREVSRQVVIEPDWGGGAIRREQLNDPLGWSSFGLSGPQTLALLQTLRQTLVHSGLKNPALCLRTPDACEHERALAANLRRALVQNQAAEASLQATVADWRAIDERTDPKVRLARYYRSLGLVAPMR